MEQLIMKLVQGFEQGNLSRRQLIERLALMAIAPAVGAAAPPAATDNNLIKAISISHVSYLVADYARTRDFYSGMFGMKVSNDDGKKCDLEVGESFIRVRSWPSGTPPLVDHMRFTIANWDTDKNVRDAAEAELTKRGLKIESHNSGFHTFENTFKDPDGFGLQMGGKEKTR